jgi:hypothetical protein
MVPLLALLLALPLSNGDASPLAAEVANCRAFLQSTVTASYGAVQEHCGPRVLKHLASMAPHRDVQAIMARTNGACRERYAACSFDTVKQLVTLVHGETDSAKPPAKDDAANMRNVVRAPTPSIPPPTAVVSGSADMGTPAAVSTQGERPAAEEPEARPAPAQHPPTRKKKVAPKGGEAANSNDCRNQKMKLSQLKKELVSARKHAATVGTNDASFWDPLRPAVLLLLDIAEQCAHFQERQPPAAWAAATFIVAFGAFVIWLATNPGARWGRALRGPIPTPVQGLGAAYGDWLEASQVAALIGARLRIVGAAVVFVTITLSTIATARALQGLLGGAVGMVFRLVSFGSSTVSTIVVCVVVGFQFVWLIRLTYRAIANWFRPTQVEIALDAMVQLVMPQG